MILERSNSMNFVELRKRYGRSPAVSEKVSSFTDDLAEFADIFELYTGAMREMSTKLENLDDEFHHNSSYSPIHHMERRIKNLESVFDKLQRQHLPLKASSIKENIFDIAGIRVICNYIDDVYAVSDALSKQSDVKVLNVKDYIENPKTNGYRSLHIIYSVPVFLSTGPVITPVEIQFRTIAMDYWASLEHQLRYKNDIPDENYARHSAVLVHCAEQLMKVEEQMQQIHRDIM
jgi:putative GTP pyrophosphokinase